MKIVGTSDEEVDFNDLPRAVRKMVELCRTIPDDEGWTTRRVADALGYGVQSLTTQATAHAALVPYRVKAKARCFWGNKKTIAKEKASKVSL